MTTQGIADRLVALCRKQDWETAQKELLAADAVSIEPRESPGFKKETKGLDAIVEKGRQFSAKLEQVYSLTVSDPVVAPSSFACTMGMDATIKGRGRTQLNELCVYEVKDGKIISERFYP